MIRQAISPRLAIRIRLNMRDFYARRALGPSPAVPATIAHARWHYPARALNRAENPYLAWPLRRTLVLSTSGRIARGCSLWRNPFPGGADLYIYTAELP